MFYLLVGLWIAACLGACLLKNVRRDVVESSCPCVAVAGLLAATLLYLDHQVIIAVVVLGVSAFLTLTMLWSLWMTRGNSNHMKHA